MAEIPFRRVTFAGDGNHDEILNNEISAMMKPWCSPFFHSVVTYTKCTHYAYN